MSSEEVFREALIARPGDRGIRQLFADFLEEANDGRGELLRLVDLLTERIDVPRRAEHESRLRAILEAGTIPVGPYWTPVPGLPLALIPPGEFGMGTRADEPSRSADESYHLVRIEKPFWLGIHTVTQRVWQDVMGSNPARFAGLDLPVEKVSWEESQEFCRRLREREGLGFRLPTEAEWEYACRAGTTTPFHLGEVLTSDLANFDGRYPLGSSRRGSRWKTTRPRGCYRPNGLGLYDMHGNVFEWIEDLYGENYDGIKSPVWRSDDPREAMMQQQVFRVHRGGGWNQPAIACRSAFRAYGTPTLAKDSLGIRVALDASDTASVDPNKRAAKPGP